MWCVLPPTVGVRDGARTTRWHQHAIQEAPATMGALLLLLLLLLALHPSAGEEVSYDITVPLKIRDKEYQITFPNTLEGTEIMARRFCEEKGDSFGITVDNFDDNCLRPIKSFLAREVDKDRERVRAQSDSEGGGAWKRSESDAEKQSMVSLNILGKDYDIFFRASQRTLTVARKFCVDNINTFGIAPGLIESHCIEPVATTINSARSGELTGRGNSEL